MAALGKTDIDISKVMLAAWRQIFSLTATTAPPMAFVCSIWALILVQLPPDLEKHNLQEVSLASLYSTISLDWQGLYEICKAFFFWEASPNLISNIEFETYIRLVALVIESFVSMALKLYCFLL